MPQSIVAFADALGTAKSSQSEDNAVSFLGRLREATDCVSQRVNGIGRLCEIQVRWFSDSIAMSSNFDAPSQLKSLLDNLAFVQAGYALNGIFLRGAVTTGPHHHSEYIDYGPALARAVELERTLAGNTTRIILSPTLQHDLRAFGTQGMPILDHAYFLDFLGALDPVDRQDLEDQIKTRYGEAKRLGNANVIEKLAWLASYYNWRIGPVKPLEYALDRTFCELP
jgi:hypothetical protein